MVNISTLLYLSLLLLVLGCSPKQANQPSSKSEGVLTSAQEKTLEKSKHVDEVLQQANKERLKEAEE